MKLFIDTSDREKIVIALGDKQFVVEGGNRKSQRLLPFITESLEKQKHTLHDIQEIEVIEGPGSFTGLRVGVSIANALGWLLKIPVNGKPITPSQIVEPKYT